jgi:predicted dehydrogenase
VQIGTQHRSAPHYAEVREMVQKGEIGSVRFVRVWNYTHRTRPSRPAGTQPPDLDWNFYLGPAPQVPFERGRFLGSFRDYFDYAGGYVTDWGTHRFDSVRQIMGEANPVTIAAAGAAYEVSDGSDTPDVVQATVQFPEFTMSYEAIQTNAQGVGGRTPEMQYYRMAGDTDRPHGVALYGTDGTILVDRIGYDVYPPPSRLGGRSGRAPRQPANALARRWKQSRDTTDLHTIAFVESVRNRQRPAADVEVGHLSTIVPHLINIAYRSGRKLHWDAATETLVDDLVSSALLTRKARQPWNLVTGT